MNNNNNDGERGREKRWFSCQTILENYNFDYDRKMVGQWKVEVRWKKAYVGGGVWKSPVEGDREERKEERERWREKYYVLMYDYLTKRLF